MAGCLAPAWESRSVSYPLGNFSGRNAIAVAHFDNDAFLDAVTVKPDALDQVMLTRGTGGGLFAEPVSIYTGLTLRTVVVTDMNGDAKTDLLVHEDGNLRMVFLPGNGDGTFGTPVFSAMIIGYSFAVADLTGDGIDDIAALTFEESGAKLTVFTGGGTGAFTETRRIALDRPSGQVAAGHLDSDGLIDVVVASAVASADDSKLDLFFGNGDGTFAPAVSLPNRAFPSSAAPTFADVEGDGDTDILVSDSLQTLSLHRNSGGRSFAAVELHTIDSPYSDNGDGLFDFAVADFTGDGVRDILANAVNGGYVATLRGHSNGTFEEVTYEPSIGYRVGPVGAVLDLDGDGRLDVMTTTWYPQSISVTSLLNRCGDAKVLLSGDGVVSAGSTVTYQLGASGLPQRDTPARVTPTGTISIVEGETVIATATLVNGAASVTMPALPAGVHKLVALYSGDAQYEPAQSPRFIQTTGTPQERRRGARH
jgi:hypothetical protein